MTDLFKLPMNSPVNDDYLWELRTELLLDEELIVGSDSFLFNNKLPPDWQVQKTKELLVKFESDLSTLETKKVDQGNEIYKADLIRLINHLKEEAESVIQKLDEKVKAIKFTGGLWFGMWAVTWPFAILEISKDSLLLQSSMLGINQKFTHEDIDTIQVKKYFPVIAYGIKIKAKGDLRYKLIIFWYVSFRFNRLLAVLKDQGWL